MTSALYIDSRGPYPKLCDSWDDKRDARRYDGTGPVVAHPPCGPWGALKHLYQGNEHDCAPIAVEQVRALGGILEHPAGSKLWEACELPPPVPGRVPDYSWEWDPWGGFSIEIDQVEWGHVARKPTWLYIVGVPHAEVTAALARRPYPGRKPTHWCSGNRKNKNGGSVPAGIKVCSAQQRRRTPLALAQWLLELAAKAEPRASAGLK